MLPRTPGKRNRMVLAPVGAWLAAAVVVMEAAVPQEMALILGVTVASA